MLKRANEQNLNNLAAYVEAGLKTAQLNLHNSQLGVTLAIMFLNQQRQLYKVNSGHGKSVIVAILVRAYLHRYPGARINIFFSHDVLKTGDEPVINKVGEIQNANIRYHVIDKTQNPVVTLHDNMSLTILDEWDDLLLDKGLVI